MTRLVRGVAEPLVLVALLSVVIAGAALMTPLIYPMVLAVGLAEDDGDFLRVYRRLLILGAAAVVLYRYRPWRDGSLAAYGLRATRRHVKSGLFAGLVTAAVILTVLGLHFALDILRWRETIDWLAVARRGGKYLLAGIVIATIEELVFRGWMVRRLSMRFGLAIAASAASAIFAFVHAFRPRVLDLAVTQDWRGCLTAFAEWISFATDMQRFGPTFLGLFLLGIVLTFLTWRSGSIVPAIGVHATGIVILYTYGTMTTRFGELPFAGGKALYDGPLVWLLLLGMLVALHPRPSSVPEAAIESVSDR